MLLDRNSKKFISFSFYVLFLGSIYTLARKYQNIQQSIGPDGVLSYFHQPMLLKTKDFLCFNVFYFYSYQVFWLFFGMSLCLPMKRLFDTCFLKNLKSDFVNNEISEGKKKYSPYLIIFPSFCDVFATILDSTGLIYTHVSVHQMLKGFIVVFTCILQYLLYIVKFGFYGLGCFQVGKSNLDSFSNISAPNPMLGNSLCVMGQLLLSFMFIYEEYILKDFEIHIFEMVGWEGIWGACLSFCILTFTFYFPHFVTGCSDNFIYASFQISNNYKLFLAVIISSLIIGPFNYFGSGLTKMASASHRSTIDSLRMCVVWLVCVLGGFEEFRMKQMYGYGLICFGSVMYNETFAFESLDNQLNFIYMKIQKKVEAVINRFNRQKVKKNNENGQPNEKNILEYVYLDSDSPNEEKNAPETLNENK